MLTGETEVDCVDNDVIADVVELVSVGITEVEVDDWINGVVVVDGISVGVVVDETEVVSMVEAAVVEIWG